MLDESAVDPKSFRSLANSFRFRSGKCEPMKTSASRKVSSFQKQKQLYRAHTLIIILVNPTFTYSYQTIVCESLLVIGVYLTFIKRL